METKAPWRRVGRIVVALLLFVAGAGLGGWYSVERRAAEVAANDEQRLQEDGALAVGIPASSALDRTDSEDSAMLTAIMNAVADNEPLRRSYRVREILGSLDSADLGRLFERAVRLGDRMRRASILTPLLARWAAVDFAAATAAVQPYLARLRRPTGLSWQSAEFAIGEAWAKAVPEQTLAEAAADGKDRWAGTAARLALEVLGEGDPARQLDALTGMPPGRLRDGLCANALRSLAEKDYPAAKAQLELISDPRKRTHLQMDLLGKLAERDTELALTEMDHLAHELPEGAAFQRLVGKVLREAGSRDVSAAIEALKVMDDLSPAQRSQAVGAMLVGWAGKEPIAALEWALASQVEIGQAKAARFFDDFEAGSISMIAVALQTDREKTLAWIRTQPPSSERNSMLVEALATAQVEDRLTVFAELSPAVQQLATWNILNGFEGRLPEAVTWVQGLEPGRVRTAATQNLAYQQAVSSPDKLDAVVQTWPPGAERDAALSGVASYLAQNSPTRAIDYAQQIADPAPRSRAFSTLASSWLREDEQAARSWLTATAELTVDQKRVILRSFEEW